MSVKLLSWNVRGLNRLEKWLQMRNLLRTWKVNIVFARDQTQVDY